MSEAHIPVALRRMVEARANWCCEYCGIAEADTWFGCEVRHIVSRKHGGLTVAENLAFACALCNRHKGSDVAALDEDDRPVELFHPRRHVWAEHGTEILGLTPISRATLRILRINAPERVEERLWASRRK